MSQSYFLLLMLYFWFNSFTFPIAYQNSKNILFKVNNIPGIEEVNMIKDDGTVIHFNNPKVQASLAANTFADTGHGENKQITDLLPGILNQLGAESLTHLKKLASNVPTADGADDAGNDADDDDDVPDLVENFDEASKDEAKENCCGGGVSDEVVEKVEELKVEGKILNSYQ